MEVVMMKLIEGLKTIQSSDLSEAEKLEHCKGVLSFSLNLLMDK